MTVRNHFL